MACRFRYVLLLFAALLSVGCVATVRAPAHVDEPVRIFLVENKAHGSIAVPTESGTLVQWDFGDWYWYALNVKDWWQAPGILFVPTKGTLARREIPYKPAATTEEVGVWLKAGRIWPLVVERPLAMAVHQALEERFAEGIDTKFYDKEIDTWFVEDRYSYHVFRTCNHELEYWLEDMDCRVEGRYWVWDFEVGEPWDNSDRRTKD
jgi:hypothetical protein